MDLAQKVITLERLAQAAESMLLELKADISLSGGVVCSDWDRLDDSLKELSTAVHDAAKEVGEAAKEVKIVLDDWRAIRKDLASIKKTRKQRGGGAGVA